MTRPLKRVGERGENKWQEISWDEAFDLIEEKLGAIREEYGPESVIFSMGTGRDIGAWICMLAYAYGSPNVMFALSGSPATAPGSPPWRRSRATIASWTRRSGSRSATTIPDMRSPSVLSSGATTSRPPARTMSLGTGSST